MAYVANGTAPSERFPAALTFIGRKLLLVPEAALIVAGLCLYAASGNSPVFALLIVLLVLSYTTRTAALHWARSALGNGQYREADALLMVATVLFPWSADTQALRGALALATGQPEAAEAWLRSANELLPDQPTYVVALSNTLLELGRPAEAAAVARQALRLDKEVGLAHLYLAEAERALGASPESVEERLRGGLKVARLPEVIAALQCALAVHLVGEQRVAEATLAVHSVEALLPRCSATRQAELRFHLGELLASQGFEERARDHFQGVETLHPQSRYAAAAWRGAHS